MNREYFTDELMRHIDWASGLVHAAANSLKKVDLKEVDFRECLLDIDDQLYVAHNLVLEYLKG